MKKYLFFFILIILSLRCSRENEKVNYDYILSTDEDIIRSISGIPDKWVFIIGGDVYGTYYVSPYGDNSNDGKRGNPWRTPSFGASQISPSDTLVILPDSNRVRPILACGENSPVFINGNCTFVASNNLFYLPQNENVLIFGDSTYTSQNIGDFGSGNIYGNPLFVKTTLGENGDYHLKESSPAVNNGTSNSAPSVDLDGNIRRVGNGSDIGCYER